MKPVDLRKAVDLLQKKSKLESVFESIDEALKAIMSNQLQMTKLLVEILGRLPRPANEKPVDAVLPQG